MPNGTQVLGLAFYEAVVNGSPSNQSLVGQLTGLDSLPQPDSKLEYHWALCANAAAAQITRKMFDWKVIRLLPLHRTPGRNSQTPWRLQVE